MGRGQNRSIFRQINRLFGPGTLTGLDDSQLLERFVTRRDEEAFAALVARHGPMVLGVCRRALADPHDADDAFQATFLVLVRRAHAIRNQELLGNWLYGVARRVAGRARALAARRKAVEALAAATLAELSARDARRAELREVLDQEIARLSARDRAVIVLCDLEGRPSDEVAQLLGVRAVALRSRLHRARERLKDRLARRGIIPGAGLAVAAAVSLPATLAEAALVSAMRYASNPASIGAVSAPVVALTEGFLGTTMMMTKLKVLAAVVTLGLMLSSVGALAQSGGGFGPPSPVGEDRLRQLEVKLDRVLSALEGLARPATSVSAAGEAKRDAPQEKPAAPLYTSPPAALTAVPYAKDGAVRVYSIAPAEPIKMPPGAAQSSPLARQLAELERRLSKLEQHVYGGGKGETPRAKGAEVDFTPYTKSADVPRDK